LFASRLYSDRDVLCVFYGTVEEFAKGQTPSSYAMEIEWPPTIEEKKHQKDYTVDPF
jgi:hypothetical protein